MLVLGEEMNTTIVTAFVDIGRDSWEGFRNGDLVPAFIKRDVDTYFERFERLCKIKNPIVCYTESKFFERIKAIREDITLVNIDTLWKDHATVVDLIRKVQTNDKFIDFVDNPSVPEYWSPEYVAINFFKSFFVAHANEQQLIKTPNAAWIDFGYCREKLFKDNYEWSFNCNGRINLFAVSALDDAPIFDIVKTGKVYIQGCHIVAPTKRWVELKGLMIQAMNQLLGVGFIDDDQTMLLMSWRMKPESFQVNAVHPSNWFVIFDEKFNCTTSTQ